MTESEEYSEPVLMPMEYCTSLWCGPLTGCCMVKDQWWAVRFSLWRVWTPLQRSVLVGVLHCCFTLRGLSHVHSIMHTARKTLKSHRCLPQNLPHLASWQRVWGCQCPQQTVLPSPAHGQSQILLFCSSLTLVEFFLSPTFIEVESLEKQSVALGWWSWLCYHHHCAWYKDRLNQLLMGLSGTDEGKDTVT